MDGTRKGPGGCRGLAYLVRPPRHLRLVLLHLVSDLHTTEPSAPICTGAALGYTLQHQGSLTPVTHPFLAAQ